MAITHEQHMIAEEFGRLIWMLGQQQPDAPIVETLTEHLTSWVFAQTPDPRIRRELLTCTAEVTRACEEHGRPSILICHTDSMTAATRTVARLDLRPGMIVPQNRVISSVTHEKDMTMVQLQGPVNPVLTGDATVEILAD